MNARQCANEQELGHRIWTIVELFYRAHAAFRELYEKYEAKVLSYTEITGTPRNQLRLTSEELGNLLDLKSLERLRDGYIHELKDLCHLVFRGHDRTDLLDRYVSDIFHEISILKEEHYNVKTYGPQYERDAAEVELRHMLDDAHNRFPSELNHIRYLFGQAQTRLEEHLASFRNFELFIRSLYLSRDGFVAAAYPSGPDHFYWRMYRLGPLEGFYRAGLSFFHSGFFAEALEAFELAEGAYQEWLFGSTGSAVARAAIAARSRPPSEVDGAASERLQIADLLLSLRRKAVYTREMLSRQPAEDSIVSLAGPVRREASSDTAISAATAEPESVPATPAPQAPGPAKNKKKGRKKAKAAKASGAPGVAALARGHVAPLAASGGTGPEVVERG